MHRLGQVDESFVDVVHDNAEMYPIARDKFSSKATKIVFARCLEGGPTPCPFEWNGELRKAVRESSRMLLQLYLYKGQRLLYEPIGSGGARTDGGWYLPKGELLEVIYYNEETHQLCVLCPRLKNALAWIGEEHTFVDLGSEFGKVKIMGLPVRYDDIVTVYSGQGSQYSKVNLWVGRFKGKRNLLYTGATRAKDVLKISELKLDDEGDDLRDKMELHPKSILWQMRLGVGKFSRAVVEQAQLDVKKEEECAARTTGSGSRAVWLAQHTAPPTAP